MDHSIESLLVEDVEIATAFLVDLLNASKNRVSGISVDHSVIHWDMRQLLVHDQKLSFLLENKRLFLTTENVSLLVERAMDLHPETVVSYFPATSLPGCILSGPGGIQLSIVQCAESTGKSCDYMHIAALRTAQEVVCSEEINRDNTTESSVEDVSIREKRNPVGDQFRSLFPLLYDSKRFRPMNCNTSIPVPFSTEMFEGWAILRVNSTDKPDVKLDQSSWTFEVQVQGKFTRKPKGPLFIGAQISKKMVCI